MAAATLEFRGLTDINVVKPLKIPRRYRDRRGFVEVVVVVYEAAGLWQITIWPSIDVRMGTDKTPLGWLTARSSCNGPVISAAEAWLRKSCRWVSGLHSMPGYSNRFVVK